MTPPIRIWVSVKHGVDVGLTRADRETGIVALDRAPRKTSDFDRNAVEEAVRIREKLGGSVTAISVGQPACKEALRDAMAIGADAAVLLTSPDHPDLDSRAVAKALAAFARKSEGFDLWLFGEGSTDHFSGTIGPRVAAELGIPSLSYVRRLRVEAASVVADRELEKEIERVRSPFPVIVTVGQEINTPRTPTFMSTLKASKKEIRELRLTDLGVSAESSKAAVRLERAFVPEVRRRQTSITGPTPADVARALLEGLRKDGVIP